MDVLRRAGPGALVGLGAVVLLGWALDVTVLKSVLPGLGTMKVNTAIGFILVGLSFRYGVYWAVAAAALGGITLLQYVLGVDLGIDTLLFPDPDSPLTSHPGRMSPITAACFALLAGTRLKGSRLAAVFLGVLAALVLVAAAGYVFDVKPFFGASVFTTGMALHTLVGFALATAIMAAWMIEDGRVVIPRGGMSYRVFRDFMLVALFAPLLAGFLLEQARDRGWLGPDLERAVLVVVLSIALAAVAWRSALLVGRYETEATALAKQMASANETLEQRVRARTQQLEQARFRMTQILHMAGEGIYGLDEQGRATFCNPAALKMLGLRNEAQVFGQVMHEVMHPEGELHPAEACPAHKTLDDGEARTVPEDRFWRTDGTSFPVAYTVSPIQIEGEHNGAVVVFHDISERIRYQAALKQSNKDLEAYASVASHDLQAPLRHIRGFAEILGGKAEQLDDEGQQFLTRIIDSTAHMQEIIDSLLAYSRLAREMEQEAVHLDAVVAHVLEVVDGDLEDASIHVEPLPTVWGDRTRLYQVFQNLILNSIRYHHPERPLEIQIHHELQGPMHVIRVEDNGIGFDQQYAERIFGMFQRLQEKSKSGVGLGLATVRRIIEQHGGTIRAEGTPGRGATFIIELPLMDP